MRVTLMVHGDTPSSSTSLPRVQARGWRLTCGAHPLVYARTAQLNHTEVRKIGAVFNCPGYQPATIKARVAPAAHIRWLPEMQHPTLAKDAANCVVAPLHSLCDVTNCTDLFC
ncbi:hypothetical protein CBL_02534 [Carabus blaptoides fortunei]